MSRFIKIGEAAKYLGVSIQTLRRWEGSGYLLPDRKTAGRKGQTRYYDLNKLSGFQKSESNLSLGSDLEPQITRLEHYCIAQG